MLKVGMIGMGGISRAHRGGWAKIDEAEVVAAITAAVALMLDKPQTSFRVVSFRRTASK